MVCCVKGQGGRGVWECGNAGGVGAVGAWGAENGFRVGGGRIDIVVI